MLPLVIIAGVAAAGAAGFFGGVQVASTEAAERARYWLTLGAAAATLYYLARRAR